MPAYLPIVAAEVATWIGIAPLVTVAVRSRRHAVDLAYWWLALAFAVSFLADNAARVLDPWAVTFVYVISQSALVGFVFLPRSEAGLYVSALCLVGVVAIFTRDALGRDYLLHVVGWLSAAGIVAHHGKALGRLKRALLTYFAGGAIAYAIYAGWANWPTWLVYQSTRAIGIALFCWAVLNPRPAFTLAERAS